MMSLAVAQRIQRAAQPTLRDRAVIALERVAESVGIGFDYENQAWVVDGRYVSCAHPASMNCNCFGKIHVGEAPAANADIH